MFGCLSKVWLIFRNRAGPTLTTVRRRVFMVDAAERVFHLQPGKMCPAVVTRQQDATVLLRPARLV